MGPSSPQGGVQGFLQSPSPQAPGHPESQTEVQVLEFIRASALTVHSLGSCTPLFRCYSSQGARPPTGDPGGTAPTCLPPSGPGQAQLLKSLPCSSLCVPSHPQILLCFKSLLQGGVQFLLSAHLIRLGQPRITSTHTPRRPLKSTGF